VTKSYETGAGRVEALHGIDAEFSVGAVTAVVGPSGSGKSTLLRLLAVLDRPSAGDVVIAGHHVGKLSPRGNRVLRREAVTHVFQRPADNFIPHLTLAEHVRLSNGGAPAPEAAGEELFERFGIAHRVNHEPPALSGGEQARAAFALALMRGARLIVADEPTAELDSESALGLLEAIRSFAAEGIAFVVASHDADVVALADEVVRLNRGRLASTGQGGARTRADGSTVRSARAEAVVTASGLRKTYRRGPEVVHAVDDVNLKLARGELNVLLGRSGSGKTTLLNVLAGWQPPDAGSVVYSLDGRSEDDPGALRWDDLAFLPQKFGLMEELSVRENVEYPARLSSCLDEKRAWIESLIEDLALAELANRLPHEISIGQQQRTALARSLALRPSVVLADEPTAHQDAASADTVVRTLRKAAEAGTSCAVATHEEALAAHADVLWTMNEGRIARIDPERAGREPLA
jgi:putative ABC transport system ATP-binding protein